MTTETRHILSKAPTRIDLAGGTLDIWPIYLFLPSPCTINLAINLHAETQLTEVQDGRGEIVLKTRDQGLEARFTTAELFRFNPPPHLELHLKLLRYFVARQPDLLTRKPTLTSPT
jgi:D-glycero-alpha-D-manno-heptose-7-phosphate kinase